ncbi:threonine synthase [Treponema sp. OMZ 840]|uniref:threonine synthase n=1 Tax=Treponema sp. OMZ 840 TaxID=244313 RepID=UPI003D8D7055
MEYTDTRDNAVRVNLKDAVLSGMNPATGGLYIPVRIPKLSPALLERCSAPSFRDIAFEIAKLYCSDVIPDTDLQAIIADCYPFNTPVVPVDPVTYVLELFHGPTCAFKDFGARFMARLMAYFNRSEKEPLHILVATSGDTGSAVGSAFSGVDGIGVTILYPKGKISPLQEKQLSTFTGNVRALAVEGTFDDCQRLVKTAFTDKKLRKTFRLSSANSINIARLLPQSFYYVYAVLSVKCRSLHDNKIENPAIIAVVPSGNFGNLTSGLIAKEMGAPIAGFVAATNSNKTVPDWIASGRYEPRRSVPTLSNAMDVGAPSNHERITAMYTDDEVKKILAAYWTDDNGTLEGIKCCHERTGYIIDPHGAVGWQAWYDIRKGAMLKLMSGFPNKTENPGLTPNIPSWAQNVLDNKAVGILLETAHPAKFGETVKSAIGREPPMPDRLEKLLHLPDNSVPMKNDYREFSQWLKKNLQ